MSSLQAEHLEPTRSPIARLRGLDVVESDQSCKNQTQDI